MSFLVLRSRFSSPAIVQSTMPGVYLITSTAQLLIAWIVFPLFRLDFSILRTLLVYSADVCFFTHSLLDLALMVLLFDNVSPSVWVAFPLCIVSVVHSSRPNSIEMSVLNIRTVCDEFPYSLRPSM